MPDDIYTNGTYLHGHPTWHSEDSPWKAGQILRMIERGNLRPRTLCEVGCGAGEVLRQLQLRMGKECRFYGYEVSPQAFQLCQAKANERLVFHLGDLSRAEAHFDLLLVIDVIEHIDDYLGFLRGIKSKSVYKIFHIPLDLSVQGILRNVPGKRRAEIGHLHYFTKATALQSLRDCGYEVLDHFYTPGSMELPHMPLRTHIANLPRRFFFPLHRDITALVFGGYSLLVLAR